MASASALHRGCSKKCSCVIMEILEALTNTELPKSEFTRNLDSTVIGDKAFSDIRLALYNEARAKGLMEEGDQPVTRKKCSMGRSVRRSTLITYGV